MQKKEDCVIMRLLRNGEIDEMRQCYGKSLNHNHMNDVTFMLIYKNVVVINTFINRIT